MMTSCEEKEDGIGIINCNCSHLRKPPLQWRWRSVRDGTEENLNTPLLYLLQRKIGLLEVLDRNGSEPSGSFVALSRWSRSMDFTQGQPWSRQECVGLTFFHPHPPWAKDGLLGSWQSQSEPYEVLWWFYGLEGCVGQDHQLAGLRHSQRKPALWEVK